jgi:hypothetical protein
MHCVRCSPPKGGCWSAIATISPVIELNRVAALFHQAAAQTHAEPVRRALLDRAAELFG